MDVFSALWSYPRLYNQKRRPAKDGVRVSSVEAVQSVLSESPKQSKKKRSTEGLLRVIVIDCDYEWLYKKVLINPITQSKPRLISHP
jgi:hypothetical protein